MTLELEWKSFNAQIDGHFNRHLWIEKKMKPMAARKVKWKMVKLQYFNSDQQINDLY